MKRLTDTAASSYTGPTFGDTRWVRATDILTVPFTLLSANVSRTQDGSERAFLHIMLAAALPAIKDSMGDELNAEFEYTVSSSGQAIKDIVSLLLPVDFPIGPLVIVPVRTPGGNHRHELLDVDEWQEAEQSRQERIKSEVDEIPF